MATGLRLIDKVKFVVGLHAVVPSTSTPKYVSMKDYRHLTAIVSFKNATTVTGSAVTLKQATAVAGTGEKALAFTKMWANLDDATSVALTETTVTSDTFTTLTTNSKTGFYIIEVDADDLDVDNSFDCVRVGTGDATAATIEVTYILSCPRYSGGPGDFVNPLAD
jgi:hypothetical protein